MDIVLQTDRLTFRRFTMDDVDLVWAMDSDPEVMRYLNGGFPIPRETIEREMLPLCLQRYQQYSHLGVWAVHERESGAFLGRMGLHPTDTEGTISLGYRFMPAAWGKGYATEGARALIDRTFRETDVQRIIADTYEENIGSRRVMEKAGMRFVRTFKMTHEQLATAAWNAPMQEVWPGMDLLYEITREQWERAETG